MNSRRRVQGACREDYFENRRALPGFENDFRGEFGTVPIGDGFSQDVYLGWHRETWQLKSFYEHLDVHGAWLYERLSGSRCHRQDGNDRNEIRWAFLNYYERPLFRRVFCPNLCPICGQRMHYGRGRNAVHGERRPSIEQIVPNAGYVLGNTMTMCYTCNVKKGEKDYVLSWNDRDPVFSVDATNNVAWAHRYKSALALARHPQLIQWHSEYVLQTRGIGRCFIVT